MANPVTLIERREGSAPDDNRRLPDSVAHPGDVVTLSVETEHPEWRYEYVKVRVVDRIDASRRLYKAVVIDEILPALFPSGTLAKGSALVFTGRDVHEVADEFEGAESSNQERGAK